MANYSLLFTMTILLTSFGVTYSEGTYGGGSYNESAAVPNPDSPAAPQPSPPTTTATTSQPSAQQSASSNDQPVVLTDQQPQTATVQPTNDTSTAELGSPALTGADLMWVIIALVIAFSVLISLIVITIKKLRR